jgi:hypothetical protein
MPDPLARLLRRLLADGSIPRTQCSARARTALQSLFDAGTLRQARKGGGLIIEVIAPGAVADFYRTRYPAADTPLAGPPRALAAARLRNAKRMARTDREPVLLRAFRPLGCTDGQNRCDLQVPTDQTGAACLVLARDRPWSLEGAIAIVENLECFLHFEALGVAADAALYASGRLSTLALTWLGSAAMARCRFLHCGDYDPVGLDEFLRLEQRVGARVTLHLPDNLEHLIRTYGRPELLRDSAAILARLRAAPHPQVQRVVRMLDDTGCGLEQELLLLAGAGVHEPPA